MTRRKRQPRNSYKPKTPLGVRDGLAPTTFHTPGIGASVQHQWRTQQQKQPAAKAPRWAIHAAIISIIITTVTLYIIPTENGTVASQYWQSTTGRVAVLLATFSVICAVIGVYKHYKLGCGLNETVAWFIPSVLWAYWMYPVTSAPVWAWLSIALGVVASVMAVLAATVHGQKAQNGIAHNQRRRKTTRLIAGGITSIGLLLVAIGGYVSGGETTTFSELNPATPLGAITASAILYFTRHKTSHILTATFAGVAIFAGVGLVDGQQQMYTTALNEPLAIGLLWVMGWFVVAGAAGINYLNTNDTTVAINFTSAQPAKRAPQKLAKKHQKPKKLTKGN